MKIDLAILSGGALARVCRGTLLTLLFLLLSIRLSSAGSATWNLNPPGNSWNGAANWTPATVPNGPADVATYGASARRSLTIFSPVEVNEIVFNAAAGTFTITATDASLTLSGTGITNNTNISQLFYVGGVGAFGAVTFRNSASVTNSVFPGTVFVYVEGGSTSTNRGIVTFEDTSSTSPTDDGTFIMNEAHEADVFGGETIFTGTSSAGFAQINNAGAALMGAPATSHGLTIFSEDSNAGGSSITSGFGAYPNIPVGETDFIDTASAAGAYLHAEGGIIKFSDDSTGGTAAISILRGGVLDISPHRPPSITIGSFGVFSSNRGGRILLGANNLTVGSNNRDSALLSEIVDGGSAGGTGGSLTKIGTGVLTLEHSNRYTGGTVVSAGALRVTNISGSATGPGPVKVVTGNLGGHGIISGAVTIGTGGGPGAFLAPACGGTNAETLTLQGALTLKDDATYTWRLEAKGGLLRADEVSANGVSISAGTLFDSENGLRGSLPPGTVFTAINNTSAAPIDGTFANLADGSTLTVGKNVLKVNYEGGDGNDLTLTVQ